MIHLVLWFYMLDQVNDLHTSSCLNLPRLDALETNSIRQRYGRKMTARHDRSPNKPKYLHGVGIYNRSPNSVAAQS